MRRLLFLILSGLALFSVWFFVTRTPFPSEPAREAVGIKKSFPSSFLGNNELRYYRNGTGPRVILIASLGREASDFNELVMKLNSNGYSTLTVEHPGISEKFSYAYSAMDYAISIYGILQEEEAHFQDSVIIGHAFGNRVARMITHNQSQLDTDVWANSNILLAAGGQVPMEPKAEQSLRDIFNPMKSHKARMKDVEYAFFADGNEIPDHWTRGWHTKTAQAQIKAVIASGEDESWHCAGGVPMLIIQPMQDRIAPIENAYALRNKCLQEVEIVEIENAGHALLPEQPDAVAEAVLAFLAEHHPAE